MAAAHYVSEQEFQKSCHEWERAVLTQVARLHGSISAEHGIGLLKKQYLPYNRSSKELDFMCALKRLFDPRAILNRGKVVG